MTQQHQQGADSPEREQAGKVGEEHKRLNQQGEQVRTMHPPSPKERDPKPRS